ncbi:MAG: pantetheine-phosphate adenylyltransferase [Epsilonproteobacteria bacterium]|nr:MAG: pantetheine-phosphate adenylyltransferase [Campylobacterota bacterium]RLA65524.1 MAG: pantetheine-phosphate adenylyltransferase [Campylobacterota bacterium]
MEYKKAVYAGTFDPFTNGHRDVLNKALKVFNEVTLLIAVSPTKKSFFSLDKRMDALREMYAQDSRVKVDHFAGLIVDYAKKNKIGSIVRGLRPVGDFESEYQMATMNHNLYPEVETVFFLTGSEVNYISSSLVKEIHGHGGDITNFVPEKMMELFK